MPERVWFRSLYWRVAFGFVAFLGVMLLVQGGMLFWLVARSSDDVAGRSPGDFAAFVASDLSAAFAAGTIADPGAYLIDHYGGVSRPVGLVMTDGRVLSSHPDVELPGPLVEMAHRRLRGRFRPPGTGPPPDIPQGRQPGPGADPRGMGPMREGPPGAPADPMRQVPPGMGGGGPQGMGGRPRGIGMASVLKDGVVVGLVVVPPTEPLPILLRQFAPTALATALGLLILATSLAALFVFRPAQQRLRALEQAARQLGAGELTARAPVAGGDEVTSVARAFNAMADELDRRARALLAATDARRQLFADVSHELMTPLTAIRGYLETLQMADVPLDDGARRRYLGIVSAEAERLEHTVGDLLDLARLEAGGGTLAIGRLDTRALFTRVIERHEREARDKGVRLTTHVDPGAAEVVGDGVRLEQVLQNLAANALRHTPAGGRIDLRAETRASAVALLVIDTGEGIAPEHLSRVFDRFYKADEARGADGRGSGLGLSIAKAVVERHGGTIAVRSEPGRETTFEVVLPQRAVSPAGSERV
jgi:signal transduction histidine kinase